ncbi:MAG: alpha/beta fold hydrolase [Bryobacteraceae bacterium]|nr:alpha/beta fold hydrolase [Bryobacteraceae bacterium]
MDPFVPFFRNAHLATIAGNFWSRPGSEDTHPLEPVIYDTGPGVRVLVHRQKTRLSQPRGHLVIIHGLEGSSSSGYVRSLSHDALHAGFHIHRFNMRSCGGTLDLALSNYHSGQTGDVLAVIRKIRETSHLPIFLTGFSLGGNVTLKLAGELGDLGPQLLSGVCAVSTPIDLDACARRIDHPSNLVYQRRFLIALKRRIRERHLQAPDQYTLEHLPKVRSIYDFDDFYTARLFDFGRAADYYRTQSARNFLDRIRVPALIIQAKDDPMIPFEVYDLPVFRENPALTLLTTDHGGHVGFIARSRPRFWIDRVVLRWMGERLTQLTGNTQPSASVSL